MTMKRNPIMEKCRKLITPEMKRSVDLSIYVADRIFEILEKKGISQRELANKLEKNEAEISKWMQGTHNFTLNTIAKIESALGERIFDTSKTKKEYIFIPVTSGWASLKNANKCPKTLPIKPDWNTIPELSNYNWCPEK